MKVGDFGLSISTLARDVRHNVATDSDGFQGTPQFAPPEQLRGDPLDVRADIYAVGATLYYLLTGQPPFDARDLAELFARVTTEPPKSPRLLRPEIPPGLAAVVLRCLAKTPAERPASYAALADALRPFSSLDDSPARPGLRLVAGVVDSVIVIVVLAVWRGWTSTPLPRRPTAHHQPVDVAPELRVLLLLRGALGRVARQAAVWAAGDVNRRRRTLVAAASPVAPPFSMSRICSSRSSSCRRLVRFHPARVDARRPLLTPIDVREAVGSIATLVLVAALFLTRAPPQRLGRTVTTSPAARASSREPPACDG